MDFNIGRIIFGLINPQLFLKKEEQSQQNRLLNFNAQMNSGSANAAQNQNLLNGQNTLLNNTAANMLQSQNAVNNTNQQTGMNVQQQGGNIQQPQNPINSLNNNINQTQQTNVQQNQNPLASLGNPVNQGQSGIESQQNTVNNINQQVQTNIQQPQNPINELNAAINSVNANKTTTRTEQNKPVIDTPNNNPAANIKPSVNEQSGVKNVDTGSNQQISNTGSNQDNIRQSVESLIKMTENPKMNNLTQTDRSVYVKNLLGLPQDLGVILKIAQNPNRPLVGGTLGLAGINQDLLQNQKILSELFQELNPAVQGTQELLNVLNNQAQTSQIKQDAVALLFSGMVSLPDISKLILQNSKQAVAALIIAMASASKKGLDGKQIQDTLKVINSCISMAESDNPAQNLKSLMMLYLPWLPLNEDIGFDLEITSPDGENDLNDSKLTVLIQTKNYGNLKGVFTLTTSNSVDVYIICSDRFPKEALQKSLMSESTAHAMNTNIDIEEIKPQKEDLNETRETKVNLSATNEMNPYLLLMAHSFIRNTIIIDNGDISNVTID